MQDLFDEELKELLQGTKIQVPESYDKKWKKHCQIFPYPRKNDICICFIQKLRL